MSKFIGFADVISGESSDESSGGRGRGKERSEMLSRLLRMTVMDNYARQTRGGRKRRSEGGRRAARKRSHPVGGGDGAERVYVQISRRRAEYFIGTACFETLPPFSRSFDRYSRLKKNRGVYYHPI